MRARYAEPPVSTPDTAEIPPSAAVSPELSRLRWAAVVAALSALVLAPCFWQRRIQAGDLSSHVYNAWLAGQIEAGKIQGLTLVRQSTNVLFDAELAWLVKTVGIPAAQRIAVSTTVLIFVWGSFALITRVCGGRRWWLLPWIAMLAYGWVFHAGFFNFLLSLGLSLWGLALLWRPSPRGVLVSLALLAAAWLAHPLPVTWAAAALAYVWLARKLPPNRRIGSGLLALAVILASRWFLVTHYLYRWSIWQLGYATGADQLVVYDARYVLLQGGILLLGGWLFLRAAKSRGYRALILEIPFQVYFLTGLTVLLLPREVLLPGYSHALNYIADRMSLPAGVMGAAVLANAPVRKGELTALLVLSLVFFSFLYRDERVANLVEDQVEATVAQLAPHQRVIFPQPAMRSRLNPSLHVLDRACIGRCFSYADYEPASGQFRLRARADNGIALSDSRQAFLVEAGEYAVKPRDLPLYQLFFCNPARSAICVRVLKAGEVAVPGPAQDQK